MAFNRQGLVKVALFLLLWGAQMTIWGWTWLGCYAEGIMRPFGYKGNWLVFAVYGLLFLAFSRLYGGWQVGYLKKLDLIVSGMLTLLFTNAITYLQVCLIGRTLMPLMPMLGMSLAQATALILWVQLSGYVSAKAFPPYGMLLVKGDEAQAATLAAKLASRPDRYAIKETISEASGLEAITQKVLSGFDAAILCGLGPKTRNNLLKLCFERSIRVYTTPKISDILIRSGSDVTLFDTPLLVNRNCAPPAGQAFLKRLMDLSLSLLGVVILSPVMLAVAVAIKRCDCGPVFFRQNRCTQGNRVFSVLKFRSMVVGAGEAPVTDHDSRVTPVGRFLRATRLDELPQLFNVIQGDMSLVGPRPEKIEHVKKYTEALPEFTYRAKAKAGLTGYAQIVGKYNTSARDKLLMDLMYITNWSLLGDVKLILVTLKVLFFKESTEGFPIRPGSVAEASAKGGK